MKPQFQRRDILCLTLPDGSQLRRRVLMRMSEKSILFDMDDRLAWPTMESTSLLDNEVYADVLVKAEVVDAQEDEYSKKAQDHGKRKYERLHDVLTTKTAEIDLLAETGRHAARQWLKEKRSDKISRKTFNEAMRQWFRGGWTISGVGAD